MFFISCLVYDLKSNLNIGVMKFCSLKVRHALHALHSWTLRPCDSWTLRVLLVHSVIPCLRSVPAYVCFDNCFTKPYHAGHLPFFWSAELQYNRD